MSRQSHDTQYGREAANWSPLCLISPPLPLSGEKTPLHLPVRGDLIVGNHRAVYAPPSREGLWGGSSLFKEIAYQGSALFCEDA